LIPIEQFHPIAVHFPIVFLLSLAALDSLAMLGNRSIGGRGGIADLSAGLAVLSGLAATAAYAFGDAAFDLAVASGVAEARLETHQLLGTTTATALGLWALLRAAAWWWRIPISRNRMWGLVLVELAFSLLVITTAYYGGQLVYEFGVNVTRTAG
jgi:uncharacterized membrane protein